MTVNRKGRSKAWRLVASLPVASLLVLTGGVNVTGSSQVYQPPPLDDGSQASNYEVITEQSVGDFKFALVRYLGEDGETCLEVQPAWFPQLVSSTSGGMCGEPTLPVGENIAVAFGQLQIEYDGEASESSPPIAAWFSAVLGQASPSVDTVETEWATGETTAVHPVGDAGEFMAVVPGGTPAFTVTAWDSAGQLMATSDVCANSELEVLLSPVCQPRGEQQSDP